MASLNERKIGNKYYDKMHAEYLKQQLLKEFSTL